MPCPYSPHDGHADIDPEVLTPAGKRAVRDITRRFTAAFVTLTLFMMVAFGFFAWQTQQTTKCAAQRYAWDGLSLGFKLENTPLKTEGFTGELLRARKDANATRAANLLAEQAQIGKRPSC